MSNTLKRTTTVHVKCSDPLYEALCLKLENNDGVSPTESVSYPVHTISWSDVDIEGLLRDRPDLIKSSIVPLTLERDLKHEFAGLLAAARNVKAYAVEFHPPWGTDYPK